jgi:GNAT superfamily N-acetyltransferase
MQVSVRRGTAEDAPALARLRWRWRTEERGEADIERGPFLTYFETWMVDHLRTHLPYVVEVDGRIAGMAWLMLAERVPSPSRMDRRTGDVQSVYVVPELRNTGVGAALIETILAEARQREFEHVTVHSADRAMTLYTRGGFENDRNWLEWRPA